MRIIVIEDLQAGMVLAKPAVNTKGQVLLGAGIPVTGKHLEVLRNFGVVEVAVEGDAPPEPPIDPRLLDQVENAMRPAFARANLKHPAMQEIYRLALMVRVRRAARGGTP
jgi:hypothetical protein